MVLLFHGMNFETRRSPFEPHGPGLRSAGLYKARGCGSSFHRPVKLAFFFPPDLCYLHLMLGIPDHPGDIKLGTKWGITDSQHIIKIVLLIEYLIHARP